jgi:hypothetical protein
MPVVPAPAASVVPVPVPAASVVPVPVAPAAPVRESFGPGSSLGARSVAHVGAGAPDWESLPVPADVRARWRAAVAAAPPGSRDRIGVDRFWEVALLESAVVGPELAAWLDAVDPASLTVTGLVEAVAASARVEAWGHARTARWAGLLGRDPEMDPQWNRLAGPPPRQRSVAGDEIAMRLGLSRLAANRLVREGIAYEDALQATGEALAAGQVDAARARLLVDRLADVPWEVATRVEDAVLLEAARWTVTRMDREIARVLLEVDPDGVGDLHDRAVADRRVQRPRALPNGMASLSVLLEAQDALRVDGVLQHQALAAKNVGDPRTLDQLRADGLRDLVVGVDVPTSGPVWEVGADEVRLDGHQVAVTVYQRVRAGGAPGSGVPDHPDDARDPDALGPDPGAPTSSDPDPTGAVAGQDVLVADATGAGALLATTLTPRRPGARSGAQVHVTISAATLLGLDDRPAELHGYGPVDALRARAIAAGGTWRRIVTDPLSGAVLDVGRTRYRPTAAIADHVRARDRTCVRPGCTVPAEHGELDHTVEFHRRCGHPPGRPGTTCVANLAPLCSRDHRLKTDGGHTLHPYAPGRFEWITAAGHRYRTRPGTGQQVRATAWLDDDPPPF